MSGTSPKSKPLSPAEYRKMVNDAVNEAMKKHTLLQERIAKQVDEEMVFLETWYRIKSHFLKAILDEQVRRGVIV